MDKSILQKVKVEVIQFQLELAQTRTFTLGGLYDEEEYYLGLRDYLSLRDDIDTILELKKHFCVVGLFTAVEVFLRNTLRILHWPDPVMSKWIRKMRLDQMKKEFSMIGVPITRLDCDWQLVMGMKAVRNCITHAGGHPDMERAKELENYKIPVNQSKMVLPERYCNECFVVVERTCERIARDCVNALRQDRVQIKKPTVADLMDTLLERSSGVTWSELSKKSQALADKRRIKMKMTIVEVRKYARDRGRLTTGHWANLKLEEFEDQSGGRLIDKP